MRPTFMAVILVGLLSQLVMPSMSRAGFYPLTSDRNSTAILTYTPLGGKKVSDTAFSAFGTALFFFPYAVEKSTTKVVYTVFIKGVPTRVVTTFNALSPPTSFEPFVLPTFFGGSGIPIIASFSFPTVFADLNSFAIGQQYDVKDGLISGISGLTLYDGSSVSADVAGNESLVDPAVLGSLPLFTGISTVSSLDIISPVPEPASAFLTGIAGVIGVAVARARCKRPA